MTHAATFRVYSPDWLDDDGAAYALTLPVSTFRQYVDAGLLPPPVKIGRHSRWSREALNAALASLGGPGKTAGIGERLARIGHGPETKGNYIDDSRSH